MRAKNNKGRTGGGGKSINGSEKNVLPMRPIVPIFFRSAPPAVKGAATFTRTSGMTVTMVDRRRVATPCGGQTSINRAAITHVTSTCVAPPHNYSAMRNLTSRSPNSTTAIRCKLDGQQVVQQAAQHLDISCSINFVLVLRFPFYGPVQRYKTRCKFAVCFRFVL